jgi:hypothetical protein
VQHATPVTRAQPTLAWPAVRTRQAHALSETGIRAAVGLNVWTTLRQIQATQNRGALLGHRAANTAAQVPVVKHVQYAARVMMIVEHIQTAWIAMPATAVSVRRITIIPAQVESVRPLRLRVILDVTHVQTGLVIWPVERTIQAALQTVCRETNVMLTPTATTPTCVRTTGVTDLQTRTLSASLTTLLQARLVGNVKNATG